MGIALHGLEWELPSTDPTWNCMVGTDVARKRLDMLWNSHASQRNEFDKQKPKTGGKNTT